jgi:hypothetical protein
VTNFRVLLTNMQSVITKCLNFGSLLLKSLPVENVIRTSVRLLAVIKLRIFDTGYIKMSPVNVTSILVIKCMSCAMIILKAISACVLLKLFSARR